MIEHLMQEVEIDTFLADFVSPQRVELSSEEARKEMLSILRRQLDDAVTGKIAELLSIQEGEKLGEMLKGGARSHEVQAFLLEHVPDVVHSLQADLERFRSFYIAK